MSTAGAILNPAWAYVAVYEAGLVDAKLKELKAKLDAKADATSKGRAA